MVDNLDVWKPGGAPPPTGQSSETQPLPDQAEGIPLRQALSVGAVLGNGWAVLRERPLLVLGVVVGLWVLNFIPASLSGVLTAAGVIDPQSVNPADLVANLGANLGVVALAFVLMPVSIWLTVGLMRALAVAVESDEVRWSLVLTSWRGALWLLLTSAVLYVAILVLMVLFMIVAFVAALLVGMALELAAPGAVPSEAAAVGILLLFTVPLLPLLTWLGLGIFPVFLAIMVEERDPLSALRVGWAAARGSRWSLLVMFLPIFFIQLLVGGGVATTQVVVGPVAGLVAALGLAPLSIALDAVYRGGWVAGWLLHVRPAAQTRRWPFFERFPSPWISA